MEEKTKFSLEKFHRDWTIYSLIVLTVFLPIAYFGAKDYVKTELRKRDKIENKVTDMFQRYDKNLDGFLDKEDIREYLNQSK